MVARTYVVVSGPPASGKSTLAPVLAEALGLPLLAKDTIKDALTTRLPVPDVETSRQLGRAAVAVLLAVAADSPVGAVIESVFFRSKAAPQLAALPGNVVEVFCRCDRAVAAARFAARTGTRSGGHFDGDRTPEELWNDEVAEPVAGPERPGRGVAGPERPWERDGGPWPVVEVDTSGPVDVDTVLGAVRRAMIGSPT